MQLYYLPTNHPRISGVGVDQLNRAMTKDPAIAREIYATMDRQFEKDIKRWRKKMV
jgi:hypothetical protein